MEDDKSIIGGQDRARVAGGEDYEVQDFSSRHGMSPDEVRERGASREWLDLVEAEYGYLMAMARSIAEQRKEQSHV